MMIRDFWFNDVEDYFASCGPPIDIQLVQLSAGPLSFRSRQVDLDGVVIEWNRVGARIRSREVYRGPGLLFGYVLQSPAELKSCGSRRDFGEAVVWPLGDELDYLAPSGLASLAIDVDQDLVDLLGWQIHGGLWRQVPVRHLLQLERVCRAATVAARKWDRGAGTEPRTGRNGPLGAGWRERVLAALEPALAPWSMEPGDWRSRSERIDRDYLVVRQVEQLFADRGTDWTLGADALAAALGVSRRTLFHAFRQWLGVGPLAYLNLVRLHQLRTRLLAASVETSSVTHIAVELGFRHMGRLSAHYREHFGEYPSETLKRGPS